MRLQTSCTCSSTLGFARHERGGDHHRRKAISPAPRAALARHRKVPQIYCGFDQEPTSFAGIVIIALFTVMSFGAPLLVGPYPSQLKRTTDNLPPSSAHWLGTDWEGFDILTLIVYGGPIPLIMRVRASIVAMFLANVLGLVG